MTELSVQLKKIPESLKPDYDRQLHMVLCDKLKYLAASTPGYEGIDIDYSINQGISLKINPAHLPDKVERTIKSERTVSITRSVSFNETEVKVINFNEKLESFVKLVPSVVKTSIKHLQMRGL